MKKIIIGTLAHVDAGKTTLTESFLYHAHILRTLGRVDHKTSFLDFDAQERKRGITIYIKNAMFKHKDTEFTLLDTPGHVDFSSEMQRTLKVLDVAIVLISALDKIQTHTKTIWQLLERYHIPTFVFINKMDLAYESEEEIYSLLKTNLDNRCINFNKLDQHYEDIALEDDALLTYYLNHNKLETNQLQQAIQNRKIFPCFFGSALKERGILEFLDALDMYCINKEYSDQFGSLVYKISRDNQGNRLTHMKIIGGKLKVKSIINNEKVDQIRQYSGEQYTMLEEISAGSLCAIKGLNNVHIDDILGEGNTTKTTLLEPCLNYTLKFLDGSDPFKAYRLLVQLQEEDPQLKITYNPDSFQITMALMGEIQIEVLSQTILERFNIAVSFENATVNYKETLLQSVEGIGHFEPLRHYAEVHLLLEPLPRNSGIIVTSTCPFDVLNANYQSQILNTLDAQEYLGVLCGFPITDIKITLLSGKAHLKHTTPSDFKEATRRALRQGLRSTKCILLEPLYQFVLELANTYVSRALYDLDMMHANYIITQENELTKLIGTAPISAMQNYQSTLLSYTKGTGSISYTVSGYDECYNAQEIIDKKNYDPDKDINNPSDSVFCSQGGSFIVRWDEVDQYMHLPYQHSKNLEKTTSITPIKRYTVSDQELQTVMKNTYKQKEKQKERVKVTTKDVPDFIEIKKQKALLPCLLVDGYNMIHSWHDLKELAPVDLAASRSKLIDILANYQGIQKGIMIIVFDAYKVDNHTETVLIKDDIHIIYTKAAQSADSYIESATKKLAKEFNVTVATSDGLEQLIILGQGALRLSSRELELKVLNAKKAIPKQLENSPINQPLKHIKDLLDEE